jgi:hypothetical protein
MCYFQNFFVSLCSDVLIQFDLFHQPINNVPLLLIYNPFESNNFCNQDFPSKKPKKTTKKKSQFTHEIFPGSNNNLLPIFNTISRSINTTMQFTTITFELMLLAASFSQVSTPHQNTFTISSYNQTH